MRIAGYVRKSIMTDKGDSIENQKKMICDYADRQYSGSTITFYEDEGFSGSNTNRPGFTQLMHDVRNGKYDMLICYRLDRISRNVSDFSGTFEEMQHNKVDFVSVKEQLDTSSPIGRAMMYICSVFAQMERETIAERVRDSSLELAKSGKWAGGSAPIGYILERRTDQNGKQYSTLVTDPNGLIYLKSIFDAALLSNSLSSLEGEFRTKGITNPAGRYISSTTLYQIVTNPVYTRCSPEIWDYYKKKGCIMASPREDFDGTSGAVSYNRTKGSRSTKHEKQDVSCWIIIKGIHEPIIDPDVFLQVQKRLGINKICKIRKYDAGLLRGILYCSCGRVMSAKRKIDYSVSSHTIYWHYICGGRARKGIYHDCNVKQVNLSKIDDNVVSALREISLYPEAIEKYIEYTSSDTRDNRITMEKDLASCKNKVSNLIARLQESETSTAGKYIISSIEILDKQIENLQLKIDHAAKIEFNKAKEQITKKGIVNRITTHMHEFDGWNFETQQNFIRGTVSKCVWNGESLKIYFL